MTNVLGLLFTCALSLLGAYMLYARASTLKPPRKESEFPTPSDVEEQLAETVFRLKTGQVSRKTAVSELATRWGVTPSVADSLLRESLS